MSPLPVSVVVPCFRSGETVERAVASVAAQSARPLELLLVDDGSGDGSAALLHRLAEHLGRDWVRVLELGTNRGPSAARNAGWEAAKGELVAFLDSDDAWHPRKLELQCTFMRGHPEVALSGHTHAMDAQADIAPPLRARRIGLCDLLLRNRFIVPSIMVRRSVPLRFPEDRRHMEDHLFVSRLALKGYRLELLEAPLAVLYKPQFGAAGQSADLFAMERGELANYRALHAEGAFGRLALLLLQGWSLAKFLRRLLIVGLRGSTRIAS